MNVAELIDDLESSGIRLWAEADQIRFRAPRGTMTEERRARVRAHRDELLAHLSGAATVRAQPDPAARHEPFPLTDIQAAYLVGRGAGYPWGGTACHAYVELEHAGTDLDPDRLAAAWAALVDRHDMLRAVVHPDGVAQVRETGEATVVVHDLRGAAPADVEAALEATRAELDHRVGDPAALPLCLLRLTRCPDRTVLHLSVDLLVVDFTSLQLLLAELAAGYAGTADPEPLGLTFRDYVLACRGLAESPQAERDRAYWRGRELPPAPELPVTGDGTERPVRFTRRELVLDAADWARLRERATAHGVTPSGALLTAYAEVVGRWSRHPRFTLTVPTFTRHPVHPDVDRLVGDFTAVELLEVDLTEALPFAGRARELGARLLEDLAHPLHTGSEVLAEMTRAAGASAGGLLMPVVFTSALDQAPSGPEPGGFRVSRAITQTPQVWIDCQVLPLAEDASPVQESHVAVPQVQESGFPEPPGGGGVVVSWDCREGVFPGGLLDDAFEAFADVVTRLVDPGSDALWGDDDPVRLPAGQAAVRERIDATAAPVPPGLLHEPVLARAATHPDDVAVVDVTGPTTYGELAARASAVAALLHARDVEPGELVAVLMDKGVEQVVGVLGVLLAGGAYLPIEPNQPAARRNTIVEDGGVRVALTQSWLVDAVHDGSPGLSLVAVDALPAGGGGTPEPVATAPGDLAYVIYTSGSTGSPKGVMISHEAALNTVVDVTARFGVGPADRVLGLAALGFDLSVYDVFGTLAAGGTLVLPDPARRGDPSHWAELVAEHGVTVWNSVPGQLQMLHDHLPPGAGAGLASLRVAMLSGDWIPVTLPDQVRALVPGLEVHSLGGATEGAIWSIHHPVGEVDPAWPSIPYGTPMANQTLRALDHRLRPCPDWVVGELYIGGSGVALGYRGDPERTAARFGVHPRTGERIYRTGDLGRHIGAGDARGQGVLEFLGREDTQVKIRGYRIELAEVEAALHTHDYVATAAVLVDSDTFSGHRLAAFVAPARITPPAPDTRPADAARAAGEPLAEERAQRLRTFTADLDEAALDAMAATLRAALADGPRTAEQVCAAVGALPRHHRIVRRWLRALVAAGRLTRTPDGVYTGLSESGPPRWDDLVAAERALGWSADLLDHVRACAATLPALLDGSVPVAGLLFPGAPADAVRAAYRDNLAVRGLHTAAAAAVAELARTRGPLRVLEIGAGVGGTTAELVPALAGLDVEYLVTDPSPFFVAEARERFADHPWVRHARLDHDGDLRAQGMAPHGVDVIVAGNALHRCTDLPAVLGRLTELLTPGGRLVLVEQTRDDSPALMISMEFLEALAGEPVDGRHATDGVFVDADGWTALLDAAGARTELVLPEPGTALAGLGQRLVSAVVKEDRARADIGVLTRHLADRLPEYMIPAHWQVLDALPHTANGKVDRAALHALLPSGETGEPVTGSGEPRDDRERELATLWAELLDRDRVGRDEDFFALGGDSLLVARLVGRLRESEPALVEIEWDVVLRHLLHRPTVAGLAEYLAGIDGAGSPATEPAGPVSPVVPLNGPDAAEVTTVLVHAGVGTIMPYRALVTEIRRRAAGKGRLVGIEVPDLDAFLDAEPAGLIERMAAEYARALLETGDRRFHVVGYCLGGLVATEVARTLTEAGADVGSFTAISSHAPAFRLEDELLSEYSFAVMMGIDAVSLGFPADAQLFTAAAQEVLAHSPGVMPDGAIAALGGEYEEVSACFRHLAGVPRAQRVSRMCDAVPPSVGTFTPAQLLRMFRTFRQSVFAITRYRADPYAGDVAFLRHAGPYPFPGSRSSVTRYWEELTLGDLTVTDIGGDHFTCLGDDHVPSILGHLVDLTGGEVLA
ncbi:non-ribosomal peptide synthetase [Pseudonocardia kunmingensis]|uniref:Phenyloxazoline synthase MbtB n=1 Tax=Pseudonocardia kunmingensis TaxID=630975 RepID=A0A543DJ24_9PSEU|nr:non-ribosomal peptide synthetase [Pseudonocardia kunmingensis]TQM09336.1 pyochelin synthetase [Pseudonocardia kunmingensis]